MTKIKTQKCDQLLPGDVDPDVATRGCIHGSGAQWQDVPFVQHSRTFIPNVPTVYVSQSFVSLAHGSMRVRRPRASPQTIWSSSARTETRSAEEEWFPPTFTFSERQHAQSDVLLTNKQDRWGPRRFATVYTTLSNVGTRLLGHRTRIREAVLCREPAQLIRRTRIKRWKLRH